MEYTLIDAAAIIDRRDGGRHFQAGSGHLPIYGWLTLRHPLTGDKEVLDWASSLTTLDVKSFRLLEFEVWEPPPSSNYHLNNRASIRWPGIKFHKVLEALTRNALQRDINSGVVWQRINERADELAQQQRAYRESTGFRRRSRRY